MPPTPASDIYHATRPPGGARSSPWGGGVQRAAAAELCGLRGHMATPADEAEQAVIVSVETGSEALDLALPDFYFTMLVPLSPVRAANATEILLGSHRCTQDAVGGCDLGAAAMDVGEVLLFNGKCVHRGRPNTGPGAAHRTLLYVVWTAPWFEQGREKANTDWASSKPYDD